MYWVYDLSSRANPSLSCSEEGARFPKSVVSSGVWAGEIDIEEAWVRCPCLLAHLEIDLAPLCRRSPTSMIPQLP